MNQVEKNKELIAKCEAFVKDIKAFLAGCTCPEDVVSMQDWEDACVVNNAESLISDVEATIVVMREEIEG